MADVKTTVKIIKTYEIELTEDQIAEILRKHFDAPDDAEVKFDVGGYIDGATIKWARQETTDG